MKKLKVWGRCFPSTITLTFLIWLVKTESHFVVRSVETGLRRLTLVVAVISLDACPFLAFSDLTYPHKDTGIGVF